MNDDFLPAPIPAAEFEDGCTCAECGEMLSGEDEVYYDGNENFCEGCLRELIEASKPIAKAFAEQNCKITATFPEYDPELEFRCTPEEYESGEKESYTPNAVLCYIRHGCTNYDELVRPLQRESVRDQVHYWAIRKRIEQLIRDQVKDDDLRDY